MSLMMMMLIFMMTTFLLSTHPLSMGLILMLQTITISMYTGLMMNKFWYSYTLFMIMIGGLLVLLIYMTSIASNKKFKFSWKMMLMNIVTMLFLYNINNPHTQLTYNKEISLELTVSKYFNLPLSMIMYMLIIYLLITLIAVVKITKTNFGPLRQK